MNPTSDRTNVTDTGYTFGGKDYQKETRLDAFNNPYTLDVVKGSAPAFNTVPSTTPNVSTTTVSNENKKKQATNMLNTVNQMTESRGQKSDGVSVKNPDGTLVTDNYQEPTLPMNASPIYGTVNGVANRIIGYNQSDPKSGSQTPTYFDSNSSTPAQSPEDQQMNAILDQMKATTDANTARQVSAIQQRFEMLRQQQKQINAGQEAGIKNALLMGGVTGKGSSSQYAPISSEGIVTAQLNYGVQQLAELDSKEQDLINEAQRAGESQNFQILEKKLAMIEKTKAAKDEVAKKLNEKIAEQTAKARETMLQMQKDTSISDLYTSGVTDTSSIIKELNKAGINVTAKEVNDSLKNTGISEIQDLAQKAAGFNAPLDVVAKIGQSKSLSEATALAAPYMKDPLETAYKKAQIQKIYQDIQQSGVDKTLNVDPSQLVAYAQEYASTGKIPTGIPKGSFGVIAQVAKESPKQYGEIVSTATGVKPGGETAYTDALANLASATQLAKQLKELDKKRIGGIVSGSVGGVFGSEDQQRYMDLRTQIIDLLSRARSGAALTPQEEKTYGGMLPGRFSEPFGLGVNSDVRIDNFVNNLSADLTNKAAAKGWTIYGVSKVNLNGKEYTVGDIITTPDGRHGRINPDKTITIVQ